MNNVIEISPKMKSILDAKYGAGNYQIKMPNGNQVTNGIVSGVVGYGLGPGIFGLADNVYGSVRGNTLKEKKTRTLRQSILKGLGGAGGGALGGYLLGGNLASTAIGTGIGGLIGGGSGYLSAKVGNKLAPTILIKGEDYSRGKNMYYNNYYGYDFSDKDSAELKGFKKGMNATKQFFKGMGQPFGALDYKNNNASYKAGRRATGVLGGAGIGGTLGALAGAGIGSAFGHSGIGALAGAGLGAIGGGVGGYYAQPAINKVYGTYKFGNDMGEYLSDPNTISFQEKAADLRKRAERQIRKAQAIYDTSAKEAYKKYDEDKKLYPFRSKRELDRRLKYAKKLREEGSDAILANEFANAANSAEKIYGNGVFNKFLDIYNPYSYEMDASQRVNAILAAKRLARLKYRQDFSINDYADRLYIY